ncbi:MAG: hypothetical protein A3K30_03910 [Deltaproteobacteria bacterium RBG_13_51_10]|nr:MAG: hypothetical protein A3K30_03910 [Deltaproteobacteria bacterium RBG_13_51_10]
MDKTEMQSQCWGCGYKAKIPGDEHISCLFNWGAASQPALNMPAGNPHGIQHGWYIFPFSYDPIWMTEECMAFSKEDDPEKKLQNDPFTKLLAILTRVK